MKKSELSGTVQRQAASIVRPKLSVQKCREILGPDCKMSDVELEAMRDQMYGLAAVIVDAFIEKHAVKKSAAVEKLPVLSENVNRPVQGAVPCVQ